MDLARARRSLRDARHAGALLATLATLLATLAALLTPFLAQSRLRLLYLALRLLLMIGILGVFVTLGAGGQLERSGDRPYLSRALRQRRVGTPARRGHRRARPARWRAAPHHRGLVDSHRRDGPTQAASGRITTAYYGPDDWFAPAYGDTLSLSGDLEPLDGRYAPPGVVAELTKARSVIVDREGGNPLLARLFDLRLALAQAIQRALPEPEAALLIGILLGLKTPVLRSRLALFTATGTIHLVVPAGLKVSILADAATRAFRPFGRWPRVIGSLLAVGAYAAVGGGGPAALRPRSWARCSCWPQLWVAPTTFISPSRSPSLA